MQAEAGRYNYNNGNPINVSTHALCVTVSDRLNTLAAYDGIISSHGKGGAISGTRIAGSCLARGNTTLKLGALSSVEELAKVVGEVEAGKERGLRGDCLPGCRGFANGELHKKGHHAKCLNHPTAVAALSSSSARGSRGGGGGSEGRGGNGGGGVSSMVQSLIAFEKFDVDQSGNIDEEELQAAMNSLGHNLSESETAALFARVDVDGDGTISKINAHPAHGTHKLEQPIPAHSLVPCSLCTCLMATPQPSFTRMTCSLALSHLLPTTPPAPPYLPLSAIPSPSLPLSTRRRS